MPPDWPRAVRFQGAAAGVPFFFKQHGEWGSATPRPAGTAGKYAIYQRPPLEPSRPIPIEAYPRQFDLLGSSVRERVGKKAAGRKLDGREWNERPALAHEGRGEVEPRDLFAARNRP